ncbi:MAG: biotin synthase BioB [Chlorobiales bacterium]|nr:biotin synthase BioB [Chlorobiales bacterium]
MRETAINKSVQKAYSVLDTGEPLPTEVAVELAGLAGEDVPDLLSLANKVKNRYAVLPDGELHSCSIINAKSGVCAENCRFCAQSLHNSADVEQYPLLDSERILQSAVDIYDEGIRHFGVVTSGYGYKKVNPEFLKIVAVIDQLQEAYPELRVCASLGVLGKETVRILAEHNVAHYNINIQVAPDRYSDLIADSHPLGDRIDTIRLLRRYGIPVCCGGILGVGETMLERVEFIYALQELDISVIPLNVLVPIDGTPLEGEAAPAITDIVKTFAICRLVHPRKIIKFAAGRETVMKDFQGMLMLAGANGFLTGGYLTTRGREIGDDRKFVQQLSGFAEVSRS